MNQTQLESQHRATQFSLGERNSFTNTNQIPLTSLQQQQLQLSKTVSSNKSKKAPLKQASKGLTPSKTSTNRDDNYVAI